ncbi:DNA internalization-related competence protein ComEC/Rec2 [Fictibacillus phosphorivorans]|uniref:DNA internalization-related competence protein ComEC/Rec2 n=1 Tax=Fictibacillus phosphorivorans TaxID=1221500 RepID=UPI0020418F3F|nr:DNA internalization-related competence protein ComEC/Rec2 [Fictibacillus phosphorivorans]MCM3716890.1 DNA internalization-related competence protein ComEC/Rec2 [Fictibacillus phosphorivorans]MCM3774561.1 DNA internalization-related competence protein ComEC/Rec2 [Fictibacillus phosphorivorans]
MISVTGIVLIVFLVIVIIFQLRSKAIVVLLFLPLFFFYHQWYEQKNTSIYTPHIIDFQGTIESIPKSNGKVITFQYKTSREILVVRYKMSSAAEKQRLNHLEVGMNCTLNGSLQEPEPRSHYYGMDYREFLHNKNIHWILEPSQLDSNSCIKVDKKNVSIRIKVWRSKSIKQLEAHFTQNTAGLINALVFGYREKIETETLDSYQKLGLTHLLAVSGFNVGIVSYFLYLVFVRMGMVKELAFVCIVIFLPVYIILTGGESSIVRAGAMGMLALCFIVFQKKIHPAVLLSLVFIAMLFWNPLYAFDLGFQLSFLMTFVLITSISLFKTRSNTQLLFITSFMCSLFSFPIILYHFFEFSLWSLPMNILYIPFVSVVLFPVSVFIVAVSCFIPSALYLLEIPVQFLFEGSVSILEVVQLVNGTLLLGRPATWLFFTYNLAILLVFYAWERNERLLFRFCVPFLLVIVLQVCIPYLNPSARVSFINVGQGDSILIELPFRKGVFLIDTGGTVSFEKEEWEVPNEEYDVTKKVVLPFIKGRGIRKLDRIILSHADMDHAGGAEFLLKNFPVQTLYLPRNKNASKLEMEVMQSGKRNGVAINRLKKGVQWGIGNSQFFVLHPSERNSSSNNRSIVLWLKLYHTSFLLTGDIEKEGEHEIIQNFSMLRADVLKVAHHGSATSSTEQFLKVVEPEFAVISSGRNNIYGHPAKDVMTRLKRKKITIYRTDQNGDIIFEVSKKDLEIHSVQ